MQTYADYASQCMQMLLCTKLSIMQSYASDQSSGAVGGGTDPLAGHAGVTQSPIAVAAWHAQRQNRVRMLGPGQLADALTSSSLTYLPGPRHKRDIRSSSPSNLG